MPITPAAAVPARVLYEKTYGFAPVKSALELAGLFSRFSGSSTNGANVCFMFPGIYKNDMSVALHHCIVRLPAIRRKIHRDDSRVVKFLADTAVHRIQFVEYRAALVVLFCVVQLLVVFFLCDFSRYILTDLDSISFVLGIQRVKLLKRLRSLLDLLSG